MPDAFVPTNMKVYVVVGDRPLIAAVTVTCEVPAELILVDGVYDSSEVLVPYLK